MTFDQYLDLFFGLNDSLSEEEQETVLKEKLDALGVTEEQQNQFANEALNLLAPRLTEQEQKQMHKNWTPA